MCHALNSRIIDFCCVIKTLQNEFKKSVQGFTKDISQISRQNSI